VRVGERPGIPETHGAGSASTGSGVPVRAPSPEVRVVTPTGEIDAHTAPQLRATILDELDDRRVNVLVIDLSGVSFLDSSALGVLVGTLKRMRERGGRLEIVLPASHARRVFEITALERVLSLHETLDEALAAS
jgi:anti-sigma B factor antagonist